MEIVFERARNEEWTCKLLMDTGREKYIYSKYKPKNSIKINTLIENSKDYIVLGLGLGYEIEYIASQTSGKVYVIESHKEYLDFIKDKSELSSLLTKENVKIIVGEDYKVLDTEKLVNCMLIHNEHITQSDLAYYSEVVKWFHNSKRIISKRILFIDHVTIARDCIAGLRKLGYEVKVIPNTISMNEILNYILDFKPFYIFSINFQSVIGAYCEQLKIPYISWSVDTPCYSLYEKEVQCEYSFKFIYDKIVANYLIDKGVQDIYHMPVAIDVERMDKVITHISKDDWSRYGCDVSFLANLTYSEYNNEIAPRIQESTRRYIDEIIKTQSKDTTRFLIKDMVDEALIEAIRIEGKIQIQRKYLLSEKDLLALLLGRYHSEVERVEYPIAFSKHFNTKVFGSENWSNHIECYWGNAAHYEEMPKVFHLAKINMNMIRSFVESGLPMRVFDVLGAGGFLLSNDKPEIEENFKIGKDLVIYRDLQDALEITEYYLNHEEERNIIARHGYETVKSRHTYIHRLKKMMDIVDRRVVELRN